MQRMSFSRVAAGFLGWVGARGHHEGQGGLLDDARRVPREGAGRRARQMLLMRRAVRVACVQVGWQRCALSCARNSRGIGSTAIVVTVCGRVLRCVGMLVALVWVVSTHQPRLWRVARSPVRRVSPVVELSSSFSSSLVPAAWTQQTDSTSSCSVPFVVRITESVYYHSNVNVKPKKFK